jgi:pimeloyl-ACP methyl ester carboxylesterase
MTIYTPNPILPSTKKSETVILLHGIWMKGPYLYLLAKRLRAQGYRATCFSYRSLQNSPSKTVAHLYHHIEGLEAEITHFVGHSLGGLLIQRLFEIYPKQRPGRVVTLGSPFTGSIVAQRLYTHPLGRHLLGRSTEDGLLIESLPPWQFTQKLGSVAGTWNFGIGQFITRLPYPNDGMVSVAETKLPGMADHCLVNTNHAGLPLSSIVAQRIVTFLRYGCFTQ